MRRLVAATAALASFALVGMAGAAGTPLEGSVGPGFAISLKDASGVAVSHLDPGAYDITVDDLSDEHNFHLTGPGGVDVSTEVVGTGTQTFSVSLVDGRYTFICDAHPIQMKGSFTVGATSSPPPPPPTTPPPPAPRLTLTVTDRAIALRTAAGKAVRSLAAGAYVVQVSDRSRRQNAHVLGAGVNRKTGIAFVGKATWRLTLAAGKLAYRSDAKAPKLRGGTVTVS